MLAIALPGGTTISTTPWETSNSVRAFDRPGVSARTIARSASPAANALDASRAVPLSRTFRRTGELADAIRLAIAASTLLTSASTDPNATLTVAGRDA